MKWIKCSERMPEKYNEVIIYNLVKIIIAQLEPDIGIFWGAGYKIPIEQVDHWMPLPEKPDDVG